MQQQRITTPATPAAGGIDLDWEIGYGSVWMARWLKYVARIEPDGEGSDVHRYCLLTVYAVGQPRRALARERIAGFKAGKARAAVVIRDLVAHGGQPQRATMSVRFEVALHFDGLPLSDIEARLARRMDAEDRRKGLLAPRIVSAATITPNDGRAMRVWTCEGTRV